MNRMRKYQRIVSPETFDAIKVRADQYRLQGRKPNAAEIARHLSDLPDVPSERWIRDLVKMPANARPDEPWRLTSSSVDLAAILSTLAAVIEITKGGRTQLAVREAELIARIHRAVPALEP